jgi:hypothetical protein
MTLFEEKLQPLAEFLEEEIKAELQQQGHVATGKLYDSIKVAVEKDSIVGAANDAFYAKYVDWGRKPGGKRVPIQVLISWVQIKGLAAGDKAISLAWAIQYSIWRNGVPTDRDEKKKMFVTRVLKDNSEKIKTTVSEAYYNQFSVEITNLIRSVKQ